MKSSLHHLRRAGFKLWLDGKEVKVAPTRAVTEAVDRFIRGHINEIAADLRAERRQRQLMDAEREADRIIQQLMKRYAGVRP